MPDRAADRGKVPLCNAAEESRAGVQGSAGGGGQERPGAREQRQNIVWRNVVLMSLLHLAAVYSLVLIPKAKPLTLLWGKSGTVARPRRSAWSRGSAAGGAEPPSLSTRLPPGAQVPVACSCPLFGTGRYFCPGIFNFCFPDCLPE